MPVQSCPCGCGRGQSTAPCRLLLQLILLFAQITSEEPEDELPSKEEWADTRLKEHNASERNDEESVPEETEGDGQRNGKEADRPDQTVTQLQVPCSDSCCPTRSREKVSHIPASARAERLCW